MATKHTVESANGGLDLVMPGPGGPWEQRLLAAVAAGEVAESVLDDKVARILLLASRVGAVGEPADEPVEVDVSALITRAAAQSTVVLARDDENPVWERPAPASIALIGPNAVSLHVLGGGSSTVRPPHVVTPEEGLRARFPAAAVRVARGGNARLLAAELDLVARSTTGSALGATYRAADGTVIAEHALDAWDGWIWDLPDEVHSVDLAATVTLHEPGEHRLSVGTVGAHRVEIDGRLVTEDPTDAGVEVILNSTINYPPGVEVTVEVAEPRAVRVATSHRVIRAGGYGAVVRAAFRHRVPERGIDEEIAEAVQAARESALTVVIVGTNEEVESEGWDRETLRLPGRQDELVEAVLAADPDAVVIVNAGAPVLLPWLPRAKTVLWSWFPGQEAGHALAAVLAGDLEPAGRLPWTLPATEADVPVPHAIPVDGVVDYSEGLHVGYRAWERDGRVPARPFGHGLGWSSWSYDAMSEPRVTDSGDLEVDVTLSNTGTRDSRETVQVYLDPPRPIEGAPDRPVRLLAGFAAAEVAAGHSRQVTVVIPRRLLETWDSAAGGWKLPGGTYTLAAGRSVRELLLHSAIHLHPGSPDPHSTTKENTQ
jgi:beta-glucosidase